jgi:hypothetical protein
MQAQLLVVVIVVWIIVVPVPCVEVTHVTTLVMV